MKGQQSKWPEYDGDMNSLKNKTKKCVRYIDIIKERWKRPVCDGLSVSKRSPVHHNMDSSWCVAGQMNNQAWYLLDTLHKV